MREDGLILDKLILAKDTAYTPSGVGPAATSPTAGSTAITTGNDASLDDNINTIVTDAVTGTDSEPETLPNINIATDENLISVELEDYVSKSADGAHHWLKSNQSGASGSAMEATPNTSKLSTKTNGSAVLNYSLQFSEAGTYNVWLRGWGDSCLLYTSPSPRDRTRSRMPSSA